MSPVNEIPAEQPESANPAPHPVAADEPRKPSFDAQRYLETTLQRRPGELLKVTRIPRSNAFRVNWYNAVSSPTSNIPGLTIMHIRESKFLRCNLDPQGQPLITYPTKQ